MKARGSALWLGLFVLLAVTLISSGKPGKRNMRHRKRDTLSAKRPNPNAEDDLLRETVALTKTSKGHDSVRSTVHTRRKHAAKRRKSKTKTAKRKHIKAKLTVLADEPKFDVVATTLLPQIENTSAPRQASTEPREHSRQDLSSGEEFPGWLPHEAKQKCGKCIWQECPAIDAMRRHCPSGVVRDQCNCCAQCASGVGMPCFMASFSPIWLPSCGDDLECVPTSEDGDLFPDSRAEWGSNVKSEGICACKDRTPVCGSNNATYDNICEFREASSRLRIYTNSTVVVVSRGPCKTAPKIDSPPADSTARAGNYVSFRCETSGFPLPRIQWFKRSGLKKKIVEEELPGYLSNAVTQMRGGPGKYQLTTWLTLDNVKKTDSGTYVCRSSNNFGTVDGYAILSIEEN